MSIYTIDVKVSALVDILTRDLCGELPIIVYLLKAESVSWDPHVSSLARTVAEAPIYLKRACIEEIMLTYSNHFYQVDIVVIIGDVLPGWYVPIRI